MSKVIELPQIVCGREMAPGDDAHRLSYTGGIELHLPRLDPVVRETIVRNRQPLAELTSSEVTQYLANAGARWCDQSFPLRRQAIELATQVTGFSAPMIARDYSIMGDFLSWRSNLFDMVAAELGDELILDEWVRRQVVRLRAFPVGRTLHILVGNVPMSSTISVVRSMLTKNQTIAKLPARDPVSALFFLRTAIAANEPDHPLSRSISALYWPQDDQLGQTFFDAVDLVCAWGQGSSIASIKRKVPVGIPFLEFGSKRSFSIVFADEITNADQAAMKIANDFIMYDQEACFSPQRLFVIGDFGRLRPALVKWLKHYSSLLPRGTASDDVESHVARTQMEALYQGWRLQNQETDWSLIEVDQSSDGLESPLSRTVFVQPIGGLDEVEQFVDSDTQTVAVYPHKRIFDVAGRLAPLGAVRFVESGGVSHFRQGFSHDGAHPLQRFVRLAHVDEAFEWRYKYGPVGDPAARERKVFGLGFEMAEAV